MSALTNPILEFHITVNTAYPLSSIQDFFFDISEIENKDFRSDLGIRLFHPDQS